MKFISLFTGIGGFDLGFERAGMECVAQVEQDRWCNEVLTAHWSNVKRLKDVRSVGKENLPTVDLICGGFPCQDVSIAGHRAGLDGNRSGLWFEFHRILTELKPEWAVIENVPGLLSSNKGRDFATIVSGLVECGYRVVWRVLDSQHFGVPQRRRRVFIVGHLRDGCAANVLFERESGERNSTQGEKTWPKTSDTIGTSANRISGKQGGLAPVVNALSAHSVGTCGADDNQAQGGHLVKYDLGVRRLTPRECERLQGFPDDWTRFDAGGNTIADTNRYRMLGNAVTVNVAHWLGKRIIDNG